MCSRPGARKNTTAWRRKRSTQASALAWRLPRPPDAVAARAERTVTRLVWPVSEPTTCWLSGRSRSTLLRAVYATSGAPPAAPQSASWAPYLARARSHSARRGGRQSSLARAPVGRRQQADALLHRRGDASAGRLAQRVAAMRVSAFSERARACGCRTSFFWSVENQARRTQVANVACVRATSARRLVLVTWHSRWHYKAPSWAHAAARAAPSVCETGVGLKLRRPRI